VAAGNWHACAVLKSGKLACWGLNDSGELGDQAASNQLTPVIVAGFAAPIEP
jgi:alpha-tubulin suppressor-like RCC1 family protein